MNPEANWIVYLVRCSDHSQYCGITNDLEKRLQAHNNGKGAKYTRSRTPVKLLARSFEMTRSQALRLESRIKKTPARRKRIALENARLHSESRDARILQEIETDLQTIASEIRQLCDGVAELAAAFDSTNESSM